MEHKDQQHTPHLRRLLFILFLFVIGIGVIVQFGRDVATAAPPQYQLPILSIGQTEYTVNEGNTIDVIVQVNVLPSSNMTVTVEYATSGGTAIPGTDYTAVSGVLTFTSSSLTQIPVTIQTNQNSTTLSDRTFNFTISNPTNATTNPTRSSATVFIRNTDPTPTPAATGSVQPIFADALEPNNSFNEASDLISGASATCNLTFYPPGDEDYFRWWGVAGVSYTISTSNLTPGLDTVLFVYSANQNLIGQNNDVEPGNFASQVTFTANNTGYFYARTINQQPGDPVNKTYCIQVSQFVEPTPTPPPSFPVGADECEWNSTFETACLITIDTTLSLNFIPTLGSPQDTDIFRLWIKPGIFYTCETEIPVGSAADTNMIFFDGNTNPFNPPLGNDDKELGDLGSRLSYLSTYTGWLYIMVGPVDVLDEVSETSLQTYTLTCTQTVATPTPIPTNTPVPVALPPGGGSFNTSTPTPTTEIPTPFPTPTPINPADFIPTPEPPPVVDVQPLPTVTPASGGTQAINIQVTVFYDSNRNYLPELNEGIMDTAVALYDNATNELLSFGQTNEAGVIRFETQTTGTVRIVVPYLNYTQIVTQASDEILIRVAPGTLPITLP